MKFRIGCDPELFVKKGDVFLSAFGLIKGDKKNPFPVRNGAVQVDGMALEFNINPADTEDQFFFSVNDVLTQMKAMVPDYDVIACPVAHFSNDYLMQQPREALELGCDPDYNAWNGTVNNKPDASRPMRTASGHIHIGWTDGQDIGSPEHISNSQAATKQLDFMLGLPSVIYDEDVERREMYGKAGCCRYKPYGVEYRTLSNAWLTSEKLTRMVYRNAILAMNRLVQGDRLVDKYGDIQSIINTSDKKEALKIIKREGIEVAYA